MALRRDDQSRYHNLKPPSSLGSGWNEIHCPPALYFSIPRKTSKRKEVLRLFRRSAHTHTPSQIIPLWDRYIELHCTWHLHTPNTIHSCTATPQKDTEHVFLPQETFLKSVGIGFCENHRWFTTLTHIFHSLNRIFPKSSTASTSVRRLHAAPANLHRTPRCLPQASEPLMIWGFPARHEGWWCLVNSGWYMDHDG